MKLWSALVLLSISLPSVATSVTLNYHCSDSEVLGPEVDKVNLLFTIEEFGQVAILSTGAFEIWKENIETRERSFFTVVEIPERRLPPVVGGEKPIYIFEGMNSDRKVTLVVHKKQFSLDLEGELSYTIYETNGNHVFKGMPVPVTCIYRRWE